MKTTTYLRWSLLIPFVVWGLSLLVFLVLTKLPIADGSMDAIDSMSFMDAFSLFLAFYVFGIILWIFPYLLLGLILFFWSFIGKAPAMIKAFALSPIAMSLLTAAVLIIIEFGGRTSGVPSGFETLDTSSGAAILLFAGVALIWGYMCVGVGYGLYRILKRREIIRDEEVLPAPQTV